jgi:eukaryotic-like serine/threonine-protein kinase
VAAREVVISSVVAAGVAAGVYFGLQALKGGGQTVEVPPLIGLRPDQARGLLDDRGVLLVLNEEKEDPRFQPGQIAEQHPLEGSRVHRGDSVSVTVVKAAATVKVPDVTGQTLGEAKLRLELAKLSAGRIVEQPSPTAPQGTVIGQGAAPGTEAHVGAGIELTVSKGPETAVVPNVVGKGMSRTKETLAQAGFAPGNVRYKSDEDRSDGVVLEQAPPAGTPAAKGSKVDLVVNQVE